MHKIGAMAALTGITTHSLRFYEKHGLLNPSVRSQAGYRLYSEDDVRCARFIRKARQVGFSLEDIQQLVSMRLDKPNFTCEEVTAITSQKLQKVTAKIAELNQMKEALEALVDVCCSGPEAATHCSILEALEDQQ